MPPTSSNSWFCTDFIFSSLFCGIFFLPKEKFLSQLLQFSPILLSYLFLGCHPAFGARPFKRTIQQRLESRLAAEILAGKFSNGDTVKIDADSHKFTFEKA